MANKRIISIFVILAFNACALFPDGISDWFKKNFEKEETGIGMAFLKIPVSARQTAMGGTSAAVNEGASGNPAKLLTPDIQKNFIFNHQNLIQGVHQEFAAFTISGDKIAAGFSMSGLFIDGLEYRTGPGESQGDFSAYDFSFSFAGAYRLYSDLSVGIRSKLIHERIFEYSAMVYAFDFGILYHIFAPLKFGATIENLGPKYSMLKDSKSSSRLPTSIRAGFALDLPSFWNMKECIALDFWKSPDVRFRIDAGAEITHTSNFSFRMGAKFNYDSQSYTAGFGYKWKSITLDYAFAPYSSSLGLAHVITLTLSI